MKFSAGGAVQWTFVLLQLLLLLPKSLFLLLLLPLLLLLNPTPPPHPRAGGPEQPEPAEVQWKQGHTVQVVRYKQVWIEQQDAEVRTTLVCLFACFGR